MVAKFEQWLLRNYLKSWRLKKKNKKKLEGDT